MAANLTPRQQKELTAQLIEQAKLQQEINGSLETYLTHLEKIKVLKNTIKENEKIVLKLEESKIGKTQTEIDLIDDKIRLLGLVNDKLKLELELHEKISKEAKVGQMVTAKMLANMAKGLAKLPSLVKNIYGDIKGSGLFEMDKAIKQSGLQMGLLGTQSKNYQATIKEASFITNELGMGVKELAEMQAGYSEELGRAVQLGQKGLEAMSEMAAATSLGAEGAAKMAAEMDSQGYSAERTSKFVQQTMDDATKMGLNASKVIKNVSANIKMLNKYNFKGGIKGLAKMAQTASKLGIDMNAISGMADKLFDIEGAVDMSAQLQVMGGAWAKLADPFQLMYMARNDMEGLTAAMGEAAASSVTFNNKNKEFEISALEMHRLRKIAEQTGVAYEELAEMGKRASKSTMIKKQMSWTVDPEMQEFLVNQAQWDENGKAKIEVNGSTKFLKDLSSLDEQVLKNQMIEKETLKERARNAQDFDSKLTNLINMMKTAFLPIVEGLNKVLGPLIKDIFANKKFVSEMKTLGEKLGDFVQGAAKIGKWVAKLALALGPTGTLVTIIGAKVLFNTVQWIANGVALGIGFNMTSGKGLSGLFSSLTSGMGGMSGAMGILAKSIGVLGAGVAGWAAGKWAGGKVSEAFGNKQTEEGDTASMWTAAGGGLAGAAIGAPFGGVGAIPGYIIGALIGAFAGGAIGQGVGDAMNQESVISHGGKANDAIVSGGKLTKIDNQDELVAYKPNGPVDNAIRGNTQSNGGTMKIEFGEIHFKFDELRVIAPGSPGTAIDLAKDPKFIRDITRMIHVETNKVINGGKVKN